MAIELFASHPHGMIPNSRFPLIVMRGAVANGGAEAVISRFRTNGWSNNWANPGVYTYPHFHSTTHECLGCAEGWIDFRLSVGEEGWTDVRLEKGDVVLMPAGVSHEDIGHSPDNVMCGGYPDGRNWDNVRPEQLDKESYRAVCKRIMSLPIPSANPATGAGMTEWLEAPSTLPIWDAWRDSLDG